MADDNLNVYNSVTIADSKTPLVIFFGPPISGKTMTLIRLSCYLMGKGYVVKPVESFRPAKDKYYVKVCDRFNSMEYCEKAVCATRDIDTILVQVLRSGKSICQMLDASGESYFRPEEPQMRLTKFVHKIINFPNTKIWVIMLEPDSRYNNQDARRYYVEKLYELKTCINPHDKVIFVFNKIDKMFLGFNPLNIKYSMILQHTELLYPNVFMPFVNMNPITKWWKPYDFDFMVFQTGDFVETADGTIGFLQGPDAYPKKLWSKIIKQIKS